MTGRLKMHKIIISLVKMSIKKCSSVHEENLSTSPFTVG